MIEAGIGLTELPTSDLTKLFRAIHRGLVPFPLRTSTFMTMGMNRMATSGSILCGLDERAARAVLTCVIAERRAHETDAS
jgi:hypothetical protein